MSFAYGWTTIDHAITRSDGFPDVVLLYFQIFMRLKKRCAEKWLRKSEQGDKWNRCLIEGMIVPSETGARDEQTPPP